MTNPTSGTILPWIAAVGAVALIALGAFVVLRDSAGLELGAIPVRNEAVTLNPNVAVDAGAADDGTAIDEVAIESADDSAAGAVEPAATSVTQRPVTLRNDGSPIGEQLVELELDGLLVVIVDGHPLVYDLATGQEVDVPQVGALIGAAGEVNSAGVVCCLDTVLFTASGSASGNWSFTSWDSASGVFSRPIVMEENEQLLFVLCCDSGPLAVLGEDKGPSAFGGALPEQVVQLETGQRRSLTSPEGPITEVSDGQHGWTWLAGTADTHLVTSYAETVYEWSWDDGWVDVGRGTVVATYPNAALVEVCDGPAQCERELRPADGSQRKLVDYGSRFDWLASLSPDGRFFAGLDRSEEGSLTLRVDDMAASSLSPDAGPNLIELDRDWFARRTNGLPVDFVRMIWVGDRHVLVAGGGMESPMLVDVESGEQNELTFLTRAAGNQPTFGWLPELSGLTDG